MIRRIAAVVLVVLASVSFLAAGVGTWMQRSTLENDVWQKRVGALGEEPAVQKALSEWTTAQLLEAIDTKRLVEQHILRERDGRLAGVVANRASARLDDFLAEQVDAFFASDAFPKIWAYAANNAHDQAVRTLRGQREAVTADDEKIQIDLIPLVQGVLAQIYDQAPKLFGDDPNRAISRALDAVDDASRRDPTEVREQLSTALDVELPADWGTVTVYDGGKLSLAQTAVRWIDRLPALTIALTAALSAAALWLSAKRRRTALQLVAGFAIACVALRLVCFALQDQVLNIVANDTDRDAAKAVMSTLIDPLTVAAAITLVVLAIVGAAIAITGPYPWAVKLRGGSRSGSEGAAAT